LGYLIRRYRSNLFALIPLGIVYLAGMTVAAVLATSMVDNGKLIAFVSGAEKPGEDLLASGRVQLAMLFGAACALPTLLALWFAPALVVFDDAGALRATTTSLRAALANWKPIALYGVTVFGMGGVLPGLVLSVAQLFGENVAGVMALFVIVPYWVAFLAIFHISDYVSYRDVFHADEALVVDPSITH
jgi:hypothetical protein